MAVVRNCLFHLLVISNFVIYVQKGIAHAQNCLRSAEEVVPKCPENQREWEEAAQRKKCSEIRMYVNCTDVEYHCLVNEFRNETIEVCTKKKVLLGFCPIYSSLNADGNEYIKAVRNDYNKKCEEYPYPCNCSSGSRSTEAYKWQCCYNGTNKLSSVESQNDTDRDKKSGQHLGLWIFLGILLLGLLSIVYGGCVFYRYKYKNMPSREAVCIWKNITCTSQIFARLSSDSREHQQTPNREDSDTEVENNMRSDFKLLSESNAPLEQASDIGFITTGVSCSEYSATSRGTTSEQNLTLGDRVKQLKELKNDLEEKLFRIFESDDGRLEYNVRRTKQRIQNMNRNSRGISHKSMFRFDQSEETLTDLLEKGEKMERCLTNMLQKTNDVITRVGDSKDYTANPGHKKPGAVNPRSSEQLPVEEKETAAKSENKLSESNVRNRMDEDDLSDMELQNDNNTHKEEEEKMPFGMPSSNLPINQKQKKDRVMPDAANGAYFVKGKGSAKDRTEALINRFEEWKRDIRKHSVIDYLKENLLEIEDDTVILNSLFGFNIPELRNENEEGGQQKANYVNDMEQIFEELSTMFEELKRKYSGML